MTANGMEKIEKVSVHGGHSGQFCNHAADTLEEVILAYIDQGFSWVGITEHTPPPSEDLLYDDERDAGLTPDYLLAQFGSYFDECRRLRDKYRSQITLYAAMEIETYTGYEHYVPFLVELFSPDYLVGSVHFVNDINFDYSPQVYDQAAQSAGGINDLYLSYFDLQYEMINLLEPSVVGHFDLIRIYDPVYRDRLEQPEIAARIKRNLRRIKELELILDLNLRALHKGASEPYVSESILRMVREYEISIAPGDDSHGVASVGNFFEQAVSVVSAHGISTDWPLPRLG